MKKQPAEKLLTLIAGGLTLLSAGFFPFSKVSAVLDWGDQGDGTYKNPVQWQDFNNPCVVRSGSTFYMISASHHLVGAPISKSTDLVNWQLVGSLYNDFSAISTNCLYPGMSYSGGSQDGEVEYHNGTWYWYNWSTAYKGMYSTAVNIEGPWTRPKPIKGTEHMTSYVYEDPCPFWDDNGQMYFVVMGNGDYGSGRNYNTKIYTMNAAGDSITNNGTDISSIFTQPFLPKGPQFIHKNGYYYFFCANDMDRKTQWVYRATGITGPYNEKKQLTDSDSAGTFMNVNFCQGSMVSWWTGTDSAYAYVSHDYILSGSPYGRRIIVSPAGWGTDNWPWMGVDIDGDGRGECVAWNGKTYNKPIPGGSISYADPSDEFNAAVLGPAWLFNHNPDTTKYSLSARPGWMRLTARKLNTVGGTAFLDGAAVNFHEDELLFAYNTMVTRSVGKYDTITTCMSTNSMIDGQRAGFCMLVKDYEWIGVAKNGTTRTIQWVKGNPASGNTSVITGPALSQDLLYIKLDYNLARGTMYYSLNGIDYTQLGDVMYPYYSAWYEGAKFGIFSYNRSSTPAGGYAEFDYVRQKFGAGNPVGNQAAGYLLTSQPQLLLSRNAVRYTLSTSAKVSIRLFDLQGRLVRTLVHSVQQPGRHSVALPETNSVGIHVLSFRAGDQKIDKLVTANPHR
jgi:beta-xylosidase